MTFQIFCYITISIRVRTISAFKRNIGLCQTMSVMYRKLTKQVALIWVIEMVRTPFQQYIFFIIWLSICKTTWIKFTYYFCLETNWGLAQKFSLENTNVEQARQRRNQLSQLPVAFCAGNYKYHSRRKSGGSSQLGNWRRGNALNKLPPLRLIAPHRKFIRTLAIL